METQTVTGWMTKDNEEVFNGKVDTGLKSTTGNDNFTKLGTEIASCNTAYGTYTVAKAEAAQGGKEQIAARNAARAELVSQLRVLLNNINAIANGNQVMLASSGFPLRNTNRTPIGTLPTPEAPVVTQGPTSGTLRAAINRIYGASLYGARLALASAPDKYLETRQSTSTRFDFQGLTPGEVYNVEMNAIGSAGATDWSDAGTIRVI